MISLYADGPNKSFSTGEITEDGFYAFHDTKYDEMRVGQIYIESDCVFISGMIEMTFEDFKKNTLPRMEWVKIEYVGKKESEEELAKRAEQERVERVARYDMLMGLQGRLFKNKEIIDGKVVDCGSIKHLPMPGAIVKIRIALGRDDMAGKIYSEPQVGSRDGHGCWWMFPLPMKANGTMPNAPFHVTDDMVLDFEYLPPREPVTA